MKNKVKINFAAITALVTGLLTTTVAMALNSVDNGGGIGVNPANRSKLPPVRSTTAPPPPATQPASSTASAITRWLYVSRAGGTRVPGGSVGSFTTTCPEGRVATNGHATEIGLGASNLGVAPLADGSGVVNTVMNPILNAPATAGAKVICINRPAGYQVIRKASTLNPKQRSRIDVGCPAGSVLIGGGTKADNGVHTASSFPSLDGRVWSGLFRSDAVLGTLNVEAYAVCASSAAVPGWQVIESGRTQIAAGEDKGWIYLHCPDGKKALAMGVYSDATTMNTGWVNFVPPAMWDSPRNQPTQQRESWYGGAANVSAPMENVFIDIRLVGICANATF